MARSNRFKNFLVSAASGALQGAPFGPKGVVAGAAVGGGLSLLQDEPQYDASGRRKAFKRLEKSALARSRRRSQEIGSQLGTDFAGRNIGGGMRAGIIAGNQRASEQATLDRLTELEFGLENEIIDAEFAVEEQARIRGNNAVAALAQQGSAFAQQILNPDPFTQDSPTILAIRKRLGIETPEKITMQDYFNIADRRVPRDSGLGMIASTSLDFAKQLGELWGLDELWEILNP